MRPIIWLLVTIAHQNIYFGRIDHRNFVKTD
ncbi:hypothetical protein N574_0117425 [Lactiplantibacillus plantarum 2165]|nr:hypothetical protein N574_0117425 [Lactiplantibacillus plantarum 2165]CDN29238.1 hypothetical protein predicted by Glimmer/Critica [Lactiplantibacillus plantarum]